MSIFSLFDGLPLSGDKTKRFLKTEILEYEHFKKDDVGERLFEEKHSLMYLPYVIVLFLVCILLFQLVRLQITQGVFNRSLAEGNRIRTREIKAPRGLIYDKNNIVLAKNQASFNLEIYPLDLPRKQQEREEIFKKLSEASQISESEITDRVKEKGLLTYDPIILKENIDRDTALLLEVKTANLSGVAVTINPVREYKDTYGLSHILGYVGKMTQAELKENPGYKTFYEIGKDGLEVSYESFLKGKPGLMQIEVDAQGRQQRQLAMTESEPGNNLVLGIDDSLEQKLSGVLANEIAITGSPGGAAIALNPKTGQVLAMASLPTFDNNLFSRPTSSREYQELLNDPSKPIFNRAVDGTYPSGSIIKPVIAAAGLEEGIVTANTTINAPGEIKVGSYVYPDWKTHGFTDIRKAIAESVNIYFYALAGGWDKIKGLGIAKMDEYLHRFGYGSKTGIDLPNEAAGLVPDPTWKEKNKKEIWYLGDTYHLGIGQGDFLVTPLQMAVAYSAILNGGEILEPQLVNRITDKDGKVIKEFQKKVVKDHIASEENLQIVKEGLRLAVTGGSAQLLKDLPIDAGAKTGTAQFGSEGKTHAWMAAFAPYRDPEIVIIVLVESGGEGHAVAGPVVHDVLNWYFSK